MGEMKFSAFLEELKAASMLVGQVKNPPFTAERFIVAIIDKYLNKETVSDETEFNFLVEALKDNITDLGKARESLYGYITEKGTVVYLDDLYMKKRIAEAGTIMAELELDEISAFALLCCIVTTPSNAIAKVADLKKKDEKSARAVKPVTEKTETVIVNRMSETRNLSYTLSETQAKGTVADVVAETKRIRTELSEKVLGQENAINVFSTGFYRACMTPMMNKNKKRPRASFLFAGPPGVGKTFLAESVAESLDIPFKRFDMSEYSDKEANLEFCGFAQTYKSSKPGNVTDFVRKNPRCVLLFDEIEKAHLCVIHLFLQLLDAGRLRDNYWNEEISFTDTIVIMTTNAGKQLYETYEGDLATLSRKVIINSLEKDINPQTGNPYFPAAICSRFASGNVVMFNHIDAHILREIARNEILKNAGNLSTQTDIDLRIDEKVYTALLFAEGSAADARTISSRAETFFNDELYELFRLISSEKVRTDITDVEKIRIEVDLSAEDEYVRNLFDNTEKPKILVFANDEIADMCKNKAGDIDFLQVSDFESAVEAVKNENLDALLIDLKCGLAEGSAVSLNIDDIDSVARDFFKFLAEEKNEIPVYLLETQNTVFSDEEITTFIRQGVRNIIRISKGKDTFKDSINHIAATLHQQRSMEKLAKENKVVSYETSQTVSRNGKEATIKLFDFKTSVAVDSEDFKNVLSAVSKPDIRFDDVIGAEDAKNELMGFVDYLKAPKKYMGTGVKAPKGILLYGPPGTGKTMLAKAMACEADVTFIAAEGNQFLNPYRGEGSIEVHDLFRTARKYAPSILFIDEIDAIAKERSGSGSGDEETLTAFLTEMDGFVSDPTRPVFVLAATNFDVEPGGRKSLDPALMRRFDRRVFIDLPNKAERALYITKKVSSNKAFEVSEGLIDNISVRSTGMSLAELDSALELALRSAIRIGSTRVTDEIFEEAFETFNGGEVKKWNPTHLERVAKHEAGHALVCSLCGEKPSYMTIVARGDHGGYMLHAEEEKEIYTKEEILSKIRTSLGGRAAEIVCYGEKDGVSTGAHGDLVSATRYARRIVCSYGMDADFGLAVIGEEEISAGGELGEKVRNAVNSILNEQMAIAIKLISDNREKLDSLVDALMNKNHLTRDEIQKAIYGENQSE